MTQLKSQSSSPEYIYYEFHPYWTVGIPSATSGHIVLDTREHVEYYQIRISIARSFLVTEGKEDHFIDINLYLEY